MGSDILTCVIIVVVDLMFLLREISEASLVVPMESDLTAC